MTAWKPGYAAYGRDISVEYALNSQQPNCAAELIPEPPGYGGDIGTVTPLSPESMEPEYKDLG